MSCSSLSVKTAKPSRLTVAPVGRASLSVMPKGKMALSVDTGKKSVLTVSPKPGAHLSVTAAKRAALTIGRVCSVSGGEIYVLAASDGVLRTKTGGYILLTPDKT